MPPISPGATTPSPRDSPLAPSWRRGIGKRQPAERTRLPGRRMGRKPGKVTQWQEGTLPAGKGKVGIPRFPHSLPRVRYAVLLGNSLFSAFAGVSLKTGAGRLRKNERKAPRVRKWPVLLIASSYHDWRMCLLLLCGMIARQGLLNWGGGWQSGVAFRRYGVSG